MDWEFNKQRVYTAVCKDIISKGDVCVIGKTLAELKNNIDNGKRFRFNKYRGDNYEDCFAFEGGLNAPFACVVCPACNAEAYFAGMAGKPLQMCVEGEWIDNTFDEVKYGWFDFIFRVAESKYKPFANNQELLYAWGEKTSFLFDKQMAMPFIWVRNKTEKQNVFVITGFRHDEGEDFVLLSQIPVSLKELFDLYEFLDGSPCGVQYV